MARSSVDARPIAPDDPDRLSDVADEGSPSPLTASTVWTVLRSLPRLNRLRKATPLVLGEEEPNLLAPDAIGDVEVGDDDRRDRTQPRPYFASSNQNSQRPTQNKTTAQAPATSQ